MSDIHSVYAPNFDNLKNLCTLHKYYVFISNNLLFESLFHLLTLHKIKLYKLLLTKFKSVWYSSYYN